MFFFFFVWYVLKMIYLDVFCCGISIFLWLSVRCVGVFIINKIDEIMGFFGYCCLVKFVFNKISVVFDFLKWYY